MKNKLFYVVALVVVIASQVFAGGSEWGTNYAQAVETAKSQNKYILLDFTGSDWCGWCIKLNKEIFSKSEFKKFAEQKLVLVEVDFPQLKTQSKDLKTQNKMLQGKHQIESFPTLIVLDSNEKVVGQLGYMPGGPAALIKELNKIIK